MSLLDKLFGKDVEAFGKELAQTVAKRYPPTLDTASERRVSASRITKVLEDALGKAADFARERKLGAYKKARLANTFKWELKELGYTERFVEVATEGLVVYMTRRGQKDSDRKEA